MSNALLEEVAANGNAGAQPRQTKLESRCYVAASMDSRLGLFVGLSSSGRSSGLSSLRRLLRLRACLSSSSSTLSPGPRQDRAAQYCAPGQDGERGEGLLSIQWRWKKELKLKQVSV